MSKGLEALDHIRLYRIELKKGYVQYIDFSACFPNDWKAIEKELKALEIIKKKEVNVAWLTYVNSLEEYNRGKFIGSCLTQEEFGFLKEMLK